MLAKVSRICPLVAIVKCVPIWQIVLIRLARTSVHVKRTSSLMTMVALVSIMKSVRLTRNAMPMPHVTITWADTRVHAMSPSGMGMAVIVTSLTHAEMVLVEFIQRVKLTLNQPADIVVHVERHL